MLRGCEDGLGHWALVGRVGRWVAGLEMPGDLARGTSGRLGSWQETSGRLGSLQETSDPEPWRET